MSDTFDGGYSSAFTLQHRDEAGVDQFAVHQYRARAALAFAAALFYAGEVQVLAKGVEEALHGRRFDGLGSIVDGKGESFHFGIQFGLGLSIE
jgi:hypothetical protein